MYFPNMISPRSQQHKSINKISLQFNSNIKKHTTAIRINILHNGINGVLEEEAKPKALFSNSVLAQGTTKKKITQTQDIF